MQDSGITIRKKRNVSFVSKLTSLGAFVPAVYYNVQVAQSVTISNEDKKYDFCVAVLDCVFSSFPVIPFIEGL